MPQFMYVCVVDRVGEGRIEEFGAVLTAIREHCLPLMRHENISAAIVRGSSGLLVEQRT